LAKYLLICSCGTNVTSSIAALKIQDKLAERGFPARDVEIKRARVAELIHLVEQLKPDAIVFTGNVPYKFPCPAFGGLPFLTGVGMDSRMDEIVEVLKKPHWAGKKRT